MTRLLSGFVLVFWVVLSITVPPDATHMSSIDPHLVKFKSVPGARITNFPCLTFSWAEPNPVNNPIIDYQLQGGNSDDTVRWFWSFPASNNSLTIGFKNKQPCWFQVSIVDSIGNVVLVGSRFYTNVPVWPRITDYNVHGTNYMGWRATTNHVWSVVQAGITNPIFTITPSSNMLCQFALPTNRPGVWYRVLEQ